MAPERLSGDPYSYPSDIWSFGVIMMELISGKFPFPGNNYFALLNAIIEGPPPSFPPEARLSADLKQFVLSCLEKEPMRRATVTELQDHPWMRAFEADEMDLSMKMEDIKF